ncbi:diguanylate cyclase (GGDEF) domain-containing protein [Desulfocurvibacter africanus PCS]|uniref:diguanylate cyclase n=1 Tax=Desulfocurvibacter africanus PCS TaxID=1262666 RepID=M5PQE5_DESAF|nr:GGDEF domain-containing protein [Desulfocurvibacter africanus]EMG36284.1 diguanylate cyclase (GGDEF) domain-containing protein [Desulfocurvibacter africanus PCS]
MSMLAYPAVFLLAGFGLLHLGLVTSGLAVIFGALPLILTVVGVGLAWRFNRSGAVFAFLALGLTYLVRAWVPLGMAVDAPEAQAVLAILALVLPLNFVLAAAIGDRGVLTFRGILQLLLLTGELTTVFILVRVSLWLGGPEGAANCNKAVAELLSSSFLPVEATTWIGLPLSGIVAVQFALLFFLYRTLRDRSPLDIGFGGALLAAAIGLGSRTPQAVDVYFTAAGLTLLSSIFMDSYRMAFLDELTGLPTRRVLKADFKKLGGGYAVAMVDVDHFKKFNDTYGHDVGDQVLRMVASRLSKVTGGGKAYRYGGEEFTVLFPKLGKKAAQPHLEALRESIEQSGFSLRGQDRPKQKPENPKRPEKPKVVSVTVSIGTAEHGAANATPDEAIKAADKALYKAKKNGRNRVELG